MADRPVSLLEWAYEQIRQRLFTGQLASGEKLVVGQLAESLSISPTPVKEALNRLVAEGLLDTMPRRGFIVKQLSGKEMREVLDCRMMMEIFATRDAVKNFDRYPEIKKSMLSALNELEKIGDCDYLQATRLEQTYHGSIIQLTNNQRLMGLYNMLFGIGFAFYVYASEKHPMERHAAAQAEHRLMYQALEHRDAQALENVLRIHLEQTINLYTTFSSAFTDGSHEQVPGLGLQSKE